MSWERAQIKIAPASVGTGIKVSLRKRGTGTAKMSITFTGLAMKSLDWSKGDKIETMIGTGEHHGLLRLRQNNSIGEAVVDERDAVRGGKYQSLKLGEQTAFVDRPEPSQWVQWEKVEDGWLEIVLPKWADETGPKRERSAPITRPTQSPQPKQSVTSSLMGDPPAGRRQMLEQLGKVKG